MEAIIKLGISSSEHGTNRQTQYYRGIFAVCLQQTTEPDFLRIFTAKQICNAAKGKSIVNRTKISWVSNPDGTQGYTWNPVTGCLHGCDFCFARKMSLRFKGLPTKRKFIEDAYVEQIIDGQAEAFILEENPGFEPTFWISRLQDPISIKKPSTIFVCSMADLFGDWVPYGWIEQILKVVHACPQHTFLFLTKNGSRMCSEGDVIDTTNAWYGQTCTGIADRPLWDISFHRHFLSFEPLLGDWIPDLKWLHVRWVIIGSLNQNGKPVSPDKGGTRKEWVTSLLGEADEFKIPVFIKPELYDLYPDLPQRQELPYLKT